jgi:hypothetical protein
MNEKKRRKGKGVTKTQISIRFNTKLYEKLDAYVARQNERGISTKKIDVIEPAIFDRITRLLKEEEEKYGKQQ